MSFILDALKKSERERRQGKTPDIHSVHSNRTAARGPQLPSRRWALLVLLLLFLLMAAVISGYLFLKEKDNPPAPVQQHSTQPTLSPPPGDEQLTLLEAPVLKPRVEQKIRIEEEPIENIPAIAPEPPPEQSTSIPQLRDLPKEFSARLPSITFAGHTYSEDRSQRMIIINNNILREGGQIDEELRLIEITWEGMILEFEGRRFLVPTN